MKIGRRFLIAFCLLLSSSCRGGQTDPQPEGPFPKVRIGWGVAFAGAAQIIEAMRHTRIPQQYGLNAEFPKFVFVPEIIEAAMAGQVEVINAGVVPAMNLLARSDNWIIAGRLLDFPLAIVSRRDDSIDRISDLKGKSIAVPFGAGSHPYVIEQLMKAGLSIGDGPEQVRLLNLKPPEQPLALSQKLVDAIGVWEPQTSLALRDGSSKVIDRTTHVAFILLQKDFANRHPGTARKLLQAYIAADFFVAANRKQVDQWYAETTGNSPEEVSRMQDIEPNFLARHIAEVNIALDQKHLESAQEVADTMLKIGLLPKKVLVSERYDPSYL